ncbi:hypothetical protein H4217_007148, partial [Coemansia sp. RSA 1939]
MKPTDTNAPADTRRCLQYWPAACAVSIDAGAQSPYEGVIGEELALDADFRRLRLLDNGSIQSTMFNLIQDVLSSNDLQHV